MNSDSQIHSFLAPPEFTNGLWSKRTTPGTMKASVAAWLLRDLAQKYLGSPAATLNYCAYSCLATARISVPGLLLRAHRYGPTPERTGAIRRLLAKRPASITLEMPDDVGIGRAAHRSVVLRRPRLGPSGLERGVLLIKFTDTSRFYFHHVEIPALQEYFCVVLEPSWAGYAVPEILAWAQTDAPVVVQASEARDRRFLESLDSALVPVSFGSSDWVDHRVFRPLETGEGKEFDALYVANYSPLKRVHVFFRAISAVAETNPDFRAALVCSSWGGTRQTVLELMEHYGVRARVALFEDLSQTRLNEVLNRSACNVLLSLKEGSNRSLFEAMFSDIPVVLLAENIGVNREYINDQTGRIVSEAELPTALLELRNNRNRFKPRHWAIQNISPEKTTAKLGSVLNDLFPGDQRRFQDLAVKVNAPEARYFHSDLVPIQAELSERVIRMFMKENMQASKNLDLHRWEFLEILDREISGR